MIEILLVLAFLAMIVFVLLTAYARMVALRDMTQSRLETDPELLPSITPYVDEERDADGLVYAKAMIFDPALSSADKRAAALPDIHQSLQGKR